MIMVTRAFWVAHLVIDPLPSAMAAGTMTSVTISKQVYLRLTQPLLGKRSMTFQVHSMENHFYFLKSTLNVHYYGFLNIIHGQPMALIAVVILCPVFFLSPRINNYC